MQFYTDPSRESDPHALPNAEVFHTDDAVFAVAGFSGLDRGFYWWPCFPGCLPDGEPIGPFETEAEAITDAQDEN